MKFLAHIWFLAALIFALFIGRQAHAQDFSESVTVSTNVVVGTNTLTYGLTFTNQSGLTFQQVVVTNNFSTAVSFISATNSQGTNGIIGSSVVFFFGRMDSGKIGQLSLTIQPAVAGLFTNTLTLNALGRTNIFITNIVTLAAAQQADLGVTIVPPIQAIITNDFVTYHIVVTNATADGVSNIVVTSLIPANVIVRNVSQSFTVLSNNYVINIGGLNGNSSADLRFDITPTNVGSLFLAAAVQAAGVIDTFPTNNIFTTNVPVIAYLSATLVAVTNSSQNLNVQNGLTEQSILLSNTGTNDVPAMRLVVTDLPGTKRLFNSVGTNNAYPFVYYSAPLAAGAQTNLLLQYAPRGSFGFTNIQLHLYAVPLPDWSPPKGASITTNIFVYRNVVLPNGNLLIEFSATPGASYTIVYSSDMTFSNAMIAPPGIVAPANRVQWIDYGPPTTVSRPNVAPMRFYRVLQSP